jgi:hypothetical protein
MMTEEAREQPKPVGGGQVEAQQGDCIYSIAARAGHLWQTVWNHPENRELREARKDPGILLPGDRVFVPQLKVKSLMLQSGKRYRIVIEGQLVWLRLRMYDGDGELLARTEYRLTVGQREQLVTTDDEGSLEAQVPVLAKQARLVQVATGEAFTVLLGHMDPTGSPGAVRKRLANLGYHEGGEEGEMSAELDEIAEALLADFRQDAALDEATSWDAVLGQLEGSDPWTS